VAAQPVEVSRIGKSGRRIVRVEPLGNVFTAPKSGAVPVFTFGPEGGDKELLFTCPVSAIPMGVWQLVQLWNRCRLMGVLPVAGGFLDQPMPIQIAFPVLWAEFKKAGGGGDAATLMAMAMMKGGKG
jgi:hypothetical protein